MSIQRSNKHSSSFSDDFVIDSAATKVDKEYETPVLLHFGDVRDVTLGPTVGIGESGNELGFRNPL